MLTPEVILEKTHLTRSFITQKLAERAELKVGIRSIFAQKHTEPECKVGEEYIQIAYK